jgi:hypothetical protein
MTTSCWASGHLGIWASGLGCQNEGLQIVLLGIWTVTQMDAIRVARQLGYLGYRTGSIWASGIWSHLATCARLALSGPVRSALIPPGHVASGLTQDALIWASCLAWSVWPVTPTRTVMRTAPTSGGCRGGLAANNWYVSGIRRTWVIRPAKRPLRSAFARFCAYGTLCGYLAPRGGANDSGLSEVGCGVACGIFLYLRATAARGYIFKMQIQPAGRWPLHMPPLLRVHAA